jgi:hypothetical protein
MLVVESSCSGIYFRPLSVPLQLPADGRSSLLDPEYMSDKASGGQLFLRQEYLHQQNVF